MLSINIDTSQFTRIMDGYANHLPEATEAGLDAVADLALRAKKREQQTTYRRPIPTGKNGKPKWKRKGTNGGWAGEQAIEKRAGERVVTTTGEPANYEGRLANLPTGADGVNRSNPASEKAAHTIEPQVGPVFEDAFRRRMGL
jgi:hypothetical protein